MQPQAASSTQSASRQRMSARGSSSSNFSLRAHLQRVNSCYHPAKPDTNHIFYSYHSYGVIGLPRSKNGASATNCVIAPSL